MDSSEDDDEPPCASTSTEQKSFDFEEWSRELDSHPAFMSKLPEDVESNEYIEALQSLKYEDEESTAEDRALAYKEDGNRNFLVKKYRAAADCYTAGLKLRPEDKQLQSILYGNRAAAHFRLENCRSALKDCYFSRKLNPENGKSILLGAKCLLKLHCPDEAAKWLDDLKTLMLKFKEAEVAILSARIDEERSRLKRDSRKAAAKQQAVERQKSALLAVLKDRGVKLRRHDGSLISGPNFEWSDIEANVGPLHSGGGLRVRLNSRNCLVWPVMFLYPERGLTDLVQSFEETSTFQQHLQQMFTTQAPWDERHDYIVEHLVPCFPSSNNDGILYLVPHKWTLKQLLCYPYYYFEGGLPEVAVLSKKSPFYEEYLSHFHKVSV